MDKKCMIGQAESCGLPAIAALATESIADNVFLTRPEELREGGVVLLCEAHATTPVAQWAERGL